jgi:hypothetical protein
MSLLDVSNGLFSCQVVVRLVTNGVYEPSARVPIEAWFPRHAFRFKVAASKRVSNLVRGGTRAARSQALTHFPLPPRKLCLSAARAARIFKDGTDKEQSADSRIPAILWGWGGKVEEGLKGERVRAQATHLQGELVRLSLKKKAERSCCREQARSA